MTRLAGHQWEGTGSGFDMTVDGYSFGEISIDGKPYTKDITIWPDHVKCPWWRAEGHNLTADDLSEVPGKIDKRSC